MNSFKKIALAFTLAFGIVMFALAQDKTVYITDSGKKYHSKNCSNAKTGKKGINLDEAKKQGYTACGVCKPDTKDVKKADNKAKDTKKK